MVEKSSVLTNDFMLALPTLSSSNWLNHLLGRPMLLFPLNFNFNILLGVKPAYEDTFQDAKKEFLKCKTLSRIGIVQKS
jgi:hypothetical protein